MFDLKDLLLRSFLLEQVFFFLSFLLTWTACWRAWWASLPPPPSPPPSCPPWGPAARPPPAPSRGWCGLSPADTPPCPNRSRWSTGPQSWSSWPSDLPASPWWPAGLLRSRSLCIWQNASLGREEVKVIQGDVHTLQVRMDLFYLLWCRGIMKFTIFLAEDKEEVSGAVFDVCVQMSHETNQAALHCGAFLWPLWDISQRRKDLIRETLWL